MKALPGLEPGFLQQLNELEIEEKVRLKPDEPAGDRQSERATGGGGGGAGRGGGAGDAGGVAVGAAGVGRRRFGAPFRLHQHRLDEQPQHLRHGSHAAHLARVAGAAKLGKNSVMSL